jgi:hypothetical protein
LTVRSAAVTGIAPAGQPLAGAIFTVGISGSIGAGKVGFGPIAALSKNIADDRVDNLTERRADDHAYGKLDSIALAPFGPAKVTSVTLIGTARRRQTGGEGPAARWRLFRNRGTAKPTSAVALHSTGPRLDWAVWQHHEAVHGAPGIVEPFELQIVHIIVEEVCGGWQLAQRPLPRKSCSPASSCSVALAR